MPIEKVFEKQEDVPEFLKSAVVKQDGKFVFTAELPEEVTGLKSALDKERKAREEYEKRLKTFEGIDPEEAKKQKETARKAEEEKAKQAGQWENWKAQMQQQFDTEKSALLKQVEALKSSLHQEMVGARATAAIAEAKGVPALLLPHIGADVVEEEGKPVVRIVKDGKVRYGKSGEPMTIAERIAEMREDEIFGRAFEPASPGGSGAQSGNKAGSAGGKTMTRAEFNKLNAENPQAAMDFIRKEKGRVVD